jgi:hypothetical protein
MVHGTKSGPRFDRKAMSDLLHELCPDGLTSIRLWVVFGRIERN